MKIIKMSVDTFWKGEVRVQGQIEDETKVYQTRIFIKGSQIYDYSCSWCGGKFIPGSLRACKSASGGVCPPAESRAYTAGFDFAGDPDDDPEYTNREVARILGEE